MNINGSNRFIKEYKNVLFRNLRANFPTLTSDELNYQIDYIINSNIRDQKVTLYNNYKEQEVDTTILKLIDYIEKNKPILVENDCLFRRHKKGFTLLYNLIDGFVENRKVLKKKMFQYDKGTDEFNKYNLMQLLAKRDANAMYGYLGSKKSSLYNINVAVAVTGSGRALITHAISFFEQFFTNNLKFYNLNEVITFIDRVCTEKYNTSDDIVDTNISLEDCWYKLISTCDERWYIENFEEYSEIIWNILSHKSQNELNRIYYKNNFFEFCGNNSYIKDLLFDLFNSIEEPFLNPNEPPENIISKLDNLTDILLDWCYMGYVIVDKYEKIRSMTRDISIITDTDSTIISTDEWYLFILSKILNRDTKVPLEAKIKPIKKEVTEDEFDMITNTSKKVIKTITEFEGEDSLRISIINSLAYIISKILKIHFNIVAENYNTKTDLKVNLINMKNEFLFKRALLSNGKKNYASIVELQEGNLIPKQEQLDIKGLPIKKTTLKKSIQDGLQDILLNNVLDSKEVSQKKVIEELARIENTIYTSLMSGDKEFYKPAAIKSSNSYKDPMGVQGIKASIVYNTIKEPFMEAIDLNKANSIDIIPVLINKLNIDKLKDTNPDIVEKITKLFEEEPRYKGEITAIALPLDEKAPEWILKFIDFKSIINLNLKNFPLESIGVTRFEKDKVNYTNVLTF